MTSIRIGRKSDLREKAWEVMATMTEARVTELAVAADISHTTASRCIRLWEKEGKVELLRVDGLSKIYRPKTKNDELPSRNAASDEKPTKQGNMWRAMRGLPNFTPTDIAVHANTPELEVTRQDAHEYCRALRRAGYLRVLQKEEPGRRETRYRLVRNTGPHAPRERRVRGIYDDNLKDFTYLAGGTS
ncbi:MAG: hypothetical protein ACP5DX_03955 [Paracoccaceae bacterium]